MCVMCVEMKAGDSPWSTNTLRKCRAPCREVSLLPVPLMKGRAGRLGLLWSPTNFPGCCPIRAGCQATAGVDHSAPGEEKDLCRDTRLTFHKTDDSETGHESGSDVSQCVS